MAQPLWLSDSPAGPECAGEHDTLDTRRAALVEQAASDRVELRPSSADAVGQSFHRARLPEVAEAVYDMPAPGCSLVLISHHVDNGRRRPADPGYPEIPADQEPQSPGSLVP